MTRHLFAVSLVFVAALSLPAQPVFQPAPPEPPEPPFQQAYQLFSSAGSRSFLGVNVAEINAERAKELKLKEEHGVEITSVVGESAAEKAGIQKGDVVLEYQGERIEGTDQFVRMVRETPAGRQVKLLISRNGATQTIAATIGTHKGSLLSRESFRVIQPSEPSIWFPDIPRAFTISRSSQLGVDSESLETQLAQFFGVKNGVLVRSVHKNSAAEKAGLKAGDVITRVEKTDVASPREVSSALRRLRSEKSIPLTVVREKKEITLSLTLDEEQGQRTTPRGRVVVNQQDF
ncbi:MAG: PDZ domain-containing protein [Bryobacteraceae bacterium]